VAQRGGALLGLVLERDNDLGGDEWVHAMHSNTIKR
jgi:hypothetical protein